MLVVEHPFQLPKGYIDGDGNLHRDGVMRLATAADEILIMNDPRVQNLPSYLMILLLSRVVIKLGGVAQVTPGVIESVFTEDLAFLQDLYNRIKGLTPPRIGVVCPKCQTRFEAEVPPPGG